MKLSVCIPNYNRPEKLYRLLLGLADQIMEEKLNEQVEICISDDRSPESPHEVVAAVRHLYPDLRITYQINDKNRGMDYNFLQSVRISEGEYCWIVGNDDEPEEKAIRTILHYLADATVDILVCPFHIYDENGNVLLTINPMKNEKNEVLYFHTENPKEYMELLTRARDGNALFCFLSNVVFRRADWVRHGDMFSDKMNTIFIQMYMNLQTLKEGAVYVYIPKSFIKNHGDAQVNETFKREYDVLVGLSGVVDFFFEGSIHDLLQERIVDSRINGRMWALPDDSPLKIPILNVKSAKNDYYKKYYVRPEKRKEIFSGKDVMVYGAGNLGKRAAEELTGYQIKSLSVYDSDEKKQGQAMEGYRINGPTQLKEKYKECGGVVVPANNLALVEIVDMLLREGMTEIAIIN
ncbi:MAG: glycosyltransferase [Eubacterium sp.]|nr:glycosyltransferase [Eubacterium sp.]